MTDYKNELVWKDVPGFENYQVTKTGLVRSKYGKGTILKQQLNPQGYYYVQFYKDRKGYCFRVHRLMLQTFVGPCPEGMIGCHYDGVRTNNNLENLRWDTHKANSADAKRHGTVALGDDHGQSKLTAKEVKVIRKLLAFGIPKIKIAQIYGVSPKIIILINRGDIWKHV